MPHNWANEDDVYVYIYKYIVFGIVPCSIPMDFAKFASSINSECTWTPDWIFERARESVTVNKICQDYSITIYIYMRLAKPKDENLKMVHLYVHLLVANLAWQTVTVHSTLMKFLIASSQLSWEKERKRMLIGMLFVELKIKFITRIGERCWLMWSVIKGNSVVTIGISQTSCLLHLSPWHMANGCLFHGWTMPLRYINWLHC